MVPAGLSEGTPRAAGGGGVGVAAHSRKLASALWEMSQKVSRVTEMQRGEVESLFRQRREESEVRARSAVHRSRPPPSLDVSLSWSRAGGRGRKGDARTPG
jgi:hypothetical protein